MQKRQGNSNGDKSTIPWPFNSLTVVMWRGSDDERVDFFRKEFFHLVSLCFCTAYLYRIQCSIHESLSYIVALS